MWYAKWNDKKYKLIDNVDIDKSSREVTYTDLSLDVSGATINDLPSYLQETKIYDNKDNLLFTGFVADLKLPELVDRNISVKRMSLSLFSPRQLTTKRTVTIIRTAKLSEILNQTIAPLFQDGFTLTEFNITDITITVKLISRTVEEVLNYLSNKYSLYWNIDELKNITINSIEYQFNKPSVKSIDIDNYKDEIKGFISISPTIQNSDYANIINVKNARIFYEKYQQEGLNVTLKNGDRLDFENPIDVSLATAQRIAGNYYTEGASTTVSNLQIIYNGSSQAYIISGFNVSGDVQDGLNIKDIGTDDSTGAKFVLTMDSTFKNLATGVTYKGEGSVTINGITSQTFLRYANMKLINWYEIEQKQGKITQSGQIEKIVDVENGWFTVNELIDYIRNLFIVNNKETNQINIKYNIENNLKVGDRIDIDLPDYFTQGNYIITSIKENKEWCKPLMYTLELRDTNLLENYIDLFRSSTDIEEQESQTEMEYVVEYAEEEEITEIHEIEFAETMNNHTLNFYLNT